MNIETFIKMCEVAMLGLIGAALLVAFLSVL